MARRSGGSHKGVEEKRRSLPIYQHYTLSPGKTKSHHPEAKCNHCLKEFVCGSKQRLIRHLRKCNSITNSDQIIAETLNTLARNSATGQLNHSILEASNLLPTQIPIETHQQQQFIGQQQSSSASAATPTLVVVGTTTATQTTSANNNNNGNNNSNNNYNANISTTANNSIISNNSNHNTSGVDNSGLIATGSNGPQSASLVLPIKRSKRGRPRKNPLNGPAIHVSTGVDGKTHFTPASQLPSNVQGNVAATNIATAGRQQPNYSYHTSNVPNTQNHVVTSGAHLSTNPAHLASTHQTTQFKLNPEPIDKAYLKLVLIRNLPLSLCDTKEFQQWVKTFANDYKPPSSINLIAQNLKNEAQMARQRISNIIVKAPKKTINLELHSWPDESRGHLWYAIIANLDHKRFLISVKDLHALQQSNSPQHSTHQDLDEAAYDKLFAEFIDDCIKRIGSDRINSLIFTKQANIKLDAFTSRLREFLHTTHPSIITYYSWWDFNNQQTCNTNLLLSDYMHRFITYGKALFEDWNQNQTDTQKYQLISNYLARFNSSIADFKLLFAAYLLNPKYKCAYMTQKAKEAARVEILNIASEFMPDESDGKTIFKQWELYLVREEPYDMIFEENRSALEWWMSLPCAESIRRVALRILRLKAFTTSKRESLFSQLYLYEDEVGSSLGTSSFEDAAVMRYFYDFEDKIGQNTTHSASSIHITSASNNTNNSFTMNGYHDRTQAGHLHNPLTSQSNDSARFLSSASLDTLAAEANGRQSDSNISLNEGRQSFLDSFSDVVVESGYMNHDHNHGDHLTNQHIENLPGYSLFMEYVNFEERGVEIVEEQTEKKRRKWTAQEILSKCQTNNNNNEIRSGK